MKMDLLLKEEAKLRNTDATEGKRRARVMDLLFGYPTEPAEIVALFVSLFIGAACLAYPDRLLALSEEVVNPVPAYAWGFAMVFAALSKSIALLLPRWAQPRWITSAFFSAWFLSITYSYAGVSTEPLLLAVCLAMTFVCGIDSFRLHTIRRLRKEFRSDNLDTGDEGARALAVLALTVACIAAIIHVATIHFPNV